MTKPSKKVIADHCTRAGATEKQAKQWASFLHGLDWDTIKPLVKMATSAHTHPALAVGLVIRSSSDETIKATLLTHLEAKAGADMDDCPYCSNPEGWDACPVHRDGVATSSTATE